MLEHATRVYPGISRAGHTWTAQWSDELGCWLPGPKWPFLEKLRDLQGIPFRQPENNGFRNICGLIRTTEICVYIFTCDWTGYCAG